MSATAELLLSLIVQKGAVLNPFAPVAKVSVTADTDELDTIEPRILVEPEVIEAQPVPHVGAVP